MLSRIPDTSLRLVYLTILLLGMAYGLAVSIVGVFLEERGYGKDAIGQLAVFFAAGIVALSIPSGALIRRFGEKRVLLGSLVGYAVAVGAFPFMDSFAGVAASRFFDGAFSVGVWVSSQTILLSRAPRSKKAYFTSLYAIMLALGYVIGPILSRGIVFASGKTASFIAAAVLALFAALVCGALLDPHAPLPEAAQGEEIHELTGEGKPTLSAGQVFWRVKMSCAATFSYGYFQASVALFLPLFLLQKGMTEGQTIMVPAFFAAGMLLFANFAAKQGDRFGHLTVMRALGLIGTGAIVSFLFVRDEALLYALIFIAGASLASVSPVSLALQGLCVPKTEMSRAAGFYNACYALGMLVGPPVSGRLFEGVSGQAMIAHFAGLWLLFALATVIFRRDDPRLAHEARPRP